MLKYQLILKITTFSKIYHISHIRLLKLAKKRINTPFLYDSHGNFLDLNHISHIRLLKLAAKQMLICP
jgi:glycerol-3-phosphate cytidylyltransferase-like family protein